MRTTRPIDPYYFRCLIFGRYHYGYAMLSLNEERAIQRVGIAHLRGPEPVFVDRPGSPAAHVRKPRNKTVRNFHQWGQRARRQAA